MKDLFGNPDETTLRVVINDQHGREVSVFDSSEDPTWQWMFEAFVSALRGAGFVIHAKWEDEAVALHRDMIIEEGVR